MLRARSRGEFRRPPLLAASFAACMAGQGAYHGIRGVCSRVLKKNLSHFKKLGVAGMAGRCESAWHGPGLNNELFSRVSVCCVLQTFLQGVFELHDVIVEIDNQFLLDCDYEDVVGAFRNAGTYTPAVPRK